MEKDYKERRIITISTIIMVIIIFAALITSLIVHNNYTINQEIEKYNNGTCKECGGCYELYCITDNGYHYFFCNKCGYEIVITHSVNQITTDETGK